MSLLFNIAIDVALAWWGWFAWTLKRPAESVRSGAPDPSPGVGATGVVGRSLKVVVHIV